MVRQAHRDPYSRGLTSHLLGAKDPTHLEPAVSIHLVRTVLLPLPQSLIPSLSQEKGVVPRIDLGRLLCLPYHSYWELDCG